MAHLEKNTEEELVEGFNSEINLHYSFTAGRAISEFLIAMRRGEIVAQRSPITAKVIVPPRGACPETGVPTQQAIRLPETATVIMFTVVHLPIPNSTLEPPFIVANLCFDEADQTFIHLIGECDNASITIGSRVRALWKDSEQWDYSFENIKYFVPIDESPVDIEKLKAERLAISRAYIEAQSLSDDKKNGSE